jgi:hypothetical protein
MVLGDFVAYRLKFQPGFIAFKTCVECGAPLSSTVEKTVIPQENDSHIIETAIKSLNAVADYSARFDHGH